jgi:hypothetical protein
MRKKPVQKECFKGQFFIVKQKITLVKPKECQLKETKKPFW